MVGVYSDLHNLMIPPHFLENRGDTILLGDVGSSSERILIFGAKRHLYLFHRADGILADGTFQVVPNLWKQQYTIHLNISEFNLPVVYALISGKTKNMYFTLLRKVKDMIGDDVHCPWIFDFEMSMMSAHKEIFSHSSSLGCFFNLTKAIHRKVDSMGFRQKYLEYASLRQCHSPRWLSFLLKWSSKALTLFG